MPVGLLQEEERCGHLVTTETKKLWAIQLGCFAEVKRICEKHGIPYFASGGTLLGAVRHHGYIPWDDDIDIMMFYKDYVRFCEIAPKEIQQPYFLQNHQTEPGFGPAMSRVRNSETTGCTQYDINMDDGHYNCGIFLDIFPLFGIESGGIKLMRQKLQISFWKNVIEGYEIKRSAQHKGLKSNVKKWLHPNVWLWNAVSLFTNHLCVSQKMLNACSKAKSYEQMALLSFTGFNKKLIWNKEWFDELIVLPFENTQMPCPKEYDPVLRTQYGDYMKHVKGGQFHTMVLCDPDTPYHIKLKRYE